MVSLGHNELISAAIGWWVTSDPAKSPLLPEPNMYTDAIQWTGRYWLEIVTTDTPGRCFKNAYELLNLRALKFHQWTKSTFFNVWKRYFVWIFKGYLWNSTQNISPLHWNMQFVYNIEILRALRCKSSKALLNRPPEATRLGLCSSLK